MFQVTFEAVFIFAPNIAQATDPAQFRLFPKEVVVDPSGASPLRLDLPRLGFEVAIHQDSMDQQKMGGNDGMVDTHFITFHHKFDISVKKVMPHILDLHRMDGD